MARVATGEFNMRTMFVSCVGLLVMAGLHAAQAQVEVAGSYGDSGAYGSYGYGGYGSAGPNGLAMLTESAIAVGPQYSTRMMLADEPAVQGTPAAAGVSDSSSSSDEQDEIIPQDLPATMSWDSRTRQSWENWYAEHVASSTAGSTAAEGLDSTGSYGYGVNGQYGYGGGSYGTNGAYFDFRSKTTFAPQLTQAADQQQEHITEQGPASDAVPDATASSSSSSSDQIVTVAQVHANHKPSIGGVSRGRGIAVQQSQRKTRTTSSTSAAVVPGQQGLAESAQSIQPVQPLSESAQRIMPIEPMSSARKLLSRALRGFNRKMLVNKQAAAAEEVLWAFRQ